MHDPYDELAAQLRARISNYVQTCRCAAPSLHGRDRLTSDAERELAHAMMAARESDPLPASPVSQLEIPIG